MPPRRGGAIVVIGLAAVVAVIVLAIDNHPKPIPVARPAATPTVPPSCTGDTILNMEAVCNTDAYVLFLTSEVYHSGVALTFDHPVLKNWFDRCAKLISDLDRCTAYMVGVLFPLIDYNIRNGVR